LIFNDGCDTIASKSLKQIFENEDDENWYRMIDIDPDSPSVVICLINKTRRNNRQTGHLLWWIGIARTPFSGRIRREKIRTTA
jgi:hypothetical protein